MGKRVPKVLGPFITAVHFTISRLPFNQASALMAFVMGNSGPAFIKTINMRRNIRDVFPDLEEPAIDKLIKMVLANFGRHIAEILHTTSYKDTAHRLRIDFSTPHDNRFDGKGPAIYVGAHVGSWELFPLVFQQHNRPLTVIYSQNEHAILDTLLMRQRAQTGATYVEKNKALKPCIQALSRGESVVLLVDQRVEQGVDVNFFGRLTAMSRFPSMLAMKFDCPIIPFEVARVEPGHLRVLFQDAIMPDGRTDKQSETSMTQDIACKVQESIIRNSDTWFCTKLRWKTADKAKFYPQQAASSANTTAVPATADL
ncbi:lysophospholipid acyltransferase family protein [Octadecabacter sp.]|nr:lysophospholipid acyltransferase family protein [Octadecabacter sp.]